MAKQFTREEAEAATARFNALMAEQCERLQEIARAGYWRQSFKTFREYVIATFGEDTLCHIRTREIVEAVDNG